MTNNETSAGCHGFQQLTQILELFLWHLHKKVKGNHKLLHAINKCFYFILFYSVARALFFSSSTLARRNEENLSAFPQKTFPTGIVREKESVISETRYDYVSPGYSTMHLESLLTVNSIFECQISYFDKTRSTA